MPKKKLKLYAIVMGVLLLVLTFSAVRRQRIRHAVTRRPLVASAVPKADLDFLEGSDTHLSDVRLEKIQPLLGDKSPQKNLLWERDPFWPMSHAASRKPVFYKKSREKQGPVFRLEGIIYRGHVKKAIVNGKVVRVGNRVGGTFRVKLITDNMVVLIGPSREIYLHF